MNNNIIQQFMAFKNSFKGDPREEVNRLLQSGQISQEQLNQAQAMASQLQGLLNKH